MANDWLILHGGALGDLVLTVQLALRLPRITVDGRLCIVTRSDIGDLSDCLPPIERIAADGLALHWLYSEADAAAGDDSPHDAPENLVRLIRGARVLNALAGAESPVHRRLLQLSPATLHSFDPRPRGDWNGHIVDQWQRDLEIDGLLFDRCIARTRIGRGLHISAGLRERGRALLGEADIAIHPGSGGLDKCWPAACFVSLANAVRASGQTPRFLVGPAEWERWNKARFAELEQAGGVIRCADGSQLCHCAAAAAVFVGNDAGPTHLAALLGTPTVALFGPTRAPRWRPLGPRVRVLSGDPARGPDWGIGVSDVLGEIRSLQAGE